MEVVLIRHTSVDVPKGTCYGQTDVPVRDTFEQEAELTRQGLEQGVLVAIDPSTQTCRLLRLSRCRDRRATAGDEHGRVGNATV